MTLYSLRRRHICKQHLITPTRLDKLPGPMGARNFVGESWHPNQIDERNLRSEPHRYLSKVQQWNEVLILTHERVPLLARTGYRGRHPSNAYPGLVPQHSLGPAGWLSVQRPKVRGEMSLVPNCRWALIPGSEGGRRVAKNSLGDLGGLILGYDHERCRSIHRLCHVVSVLQVPDGGRS